jgi:hypothetical protein
LQIKRYAANLLEIDTAVEEETRARADIEDQVSTSERKGKRWNSPMTQVFVLFESDFSSLPL